MTLQWIDWLAIGAYVLAIAGASLLLSRQPKSSEDYFLAGRSIPWLVTIASFFATCISALTFIGTPAEGFSSPEWQDKILHAQIQVGDNVILASDAPPDRYSKPEGFRVCLHVRSAEEAERAYKGLSENGTVEMPLEETFFAIRFAMLRDQFNIPWMVICEKTPS